MGSEMDWAERIQMNDDAECDLVCWLLIDKQILQKEQ